LPKDLYEDIDKIVKEDLKGIVNDEDIRFIIQNRMDSKKISFGDLPTLTLAFLALVFSSISLTIVEGTTRLTIIGSIIFVAVLFVIIFYANSKLQKEYDLILEKYIELRKNQGKT
jgi:ammonia channel protein AmtB